MSSTGIRTLSLGWKRRGAVWQGLILATVGLTAVGCSSAEETGPEVTDADGDGLSVEAGDCDDSRADVNPSATEVCDGVDQDCDQQVDEGVTLTVYSDGDGDEVGAANTATQACAVGAGQVTVPGDCDDTDASLSPYAVESCDGVDNNCNGDIDDEEDGGATANLTTFYVDGDRDGYGDAGGETLDACEKPTGYADNTEDCDDMDPSVRPGATELCNGVDEDCSGEADDLEIQWYPDADGDGYGDSSSVTTGGCEAPAGTVSNALDCNDSVATVLPGGLEVADSLDNDCDGQVDEAVTIVAGGYYHSLAVRLEGTMAGWGYNDEGQLGDGTENDASVPVAMAGFTDLVQATGGDLFTLALRSDGLIMGCGDNFMGQLATGDEDDRPTAVTSPLIDDVVAIAAGKWHSMAVKSDGTLWAWGSNRALQLGQDESETQISTPVQVFGPEDVVAIAAGDSFSAALDSAGQVWTWGSNSEGQLGDGTRTDRSEPRVVEGLSRVVSLEAGSSHLFVILEDGTVWGWGGNQYGQLGDGTSVAFRTQPVPLPLLEDVVLLHGGRYHSAALDAHGEVWAWGSNDYGQLGDGTNQSRTEPGKVPGLEGITALGGGLYHTLATADGSTLYAWGDNLYGQLGNGTKDPSTSPTEVKPLP